jgi:hypothetical protein
MNESHQDPLENEPVGIIIAWGNRGDVTPRVSAYVWGPVPAEDRPASKAA